MPQASGSRQSVGYIAEVAYGTTPATPAFKALRLNSTTLALSKSTFGSNELRGDRQLADFRMGMRQATGNVVGELSAGSYDDILEGAMGSTWASNVLKAGVAQKSFTIERKFADVAQYLRYRGMEVDSMALSFTSGAVVGITFGFMGQNMDAPATSAIAGATYPAPLTSAPMDALTAAVQEGGSPIAIVTEVSMTLNNNLAQRPVIGSNQSLEPSWGRSILTGQMTAYFDDSSLYNKYINETASSLQVVASDGTKSYTFLVPKLKYTGADNPVSGEGPVMVTMPFQGLLDPVTGTNLQITRVP